MLRCVILDNFARITLLSLVSQSFMTQKYTAIIHREENLYVAECPELDVVSQGDSPAEAQINLQEAVELFLEVASPSEIQRRLEGKTVALLEVSVG
jgi:predicted RNase H-like HicB family nuclease